MSIGTGKAWEIESLYSLLSGEKTRCFEIPFIEKGRVILYQKLEAKLINQLFLFLRGLD